MKIFFYLGANLHQETLSIILGVSDSVVLYEKENARHDLDSIRALARAGRAFSIDPSEVSSSPRILSESSINDRERIIRAVLNDFKVFLLRTRFLRVDLDGAFKGFAYFSDVIDYTLGLVEKDRPEVVFCSYTPHTVESWIVVRTLEEIGARVVRLISSPLPWVLLPVCGLTNGASCNLKAMRRTIRSDGLEKYLSTLRGVRSDALPFYLKHRSVSLRRLFANMTQRHVRWIIKYFEKRVIRKEFERAASPLVSMSAFAVYFLHYQPEMNTLPEADLYCDQFQAIKKLSDSLPPNVKLIVREHPSTFAEQTDLRWRPLGFYGRITSLPNVRLCEEQSDAFELIDRSIFVASISGVCLTEALARGKAAVTFHTPRFTHFYKKGGVIDANLRTVSELREVFAKVAQGEWVIDESDLMESFRQIMACGYDGAQDDTFIPRSAAQSAANSRRANCLAIRDVLDGAL